MFSVKLIKMFICGDLRSPNSLKLCMHNLICFLFYFCLNAREDACSNTDKKAASTGNLKLNDRSIYKCFMCKRASQIFILFSFNESSYPTTPCLSFPQSFISFTLSVSLSNPSLPALTVLAFLNDHVPLWEDCEPSGFKYELVG